MIEVLFKNASITIDVVLQSITIDIVNPQFTFSSTFYGLSRLFAKTNVRQRSSRKD